MHQQRERPQHAGKDRDRTRKQHGKVKLSVHSSSLTGCLTSLWEFLTCLASLAPSNLSKTMPNGIYCLFVGGFLVSHLIHHHSVALGFISTVKLTLMFRYFSIPLSDPIRMHLDFNYKEQEGRGNSTLHKMVSCYFA